VPDLANRNTRTGIPALFAGAAKRPAPGFGDAGLTDVENGHMNDATPRVGGERCTRFGCIDSPMHASAATRYPLSG
jgi:hypothetical protein